MATTLPAPSDPGTTGTEKGKGCSPWGEICELNLEEEEGRWLYCLGDSNVSKVQRSVVEVDEDVVVTEGWDIRFVVEFEAVESVYALDCPLFGG